MGYGKALYRAKINRILEIMLLKNYGQTDLGSMSGLSASFISKVLSGSKVSLVSATKVATALGVQAKEIFTVNNEEYDLAQTQLETTGADIDEGVKLQICVKSSAYQVLEKQAEEKLVTISSYVENIIYEYIAGKSTPPIDFAPFLDKIQNALDQLKQAATKTPRNTSGKIKKFNTSNFPALTSQSVELINKYQSPNPYPKNAKEYDLRGDLRKLVNAYGEIAFPGPDNGMMYREATKDFVSQMSKKYTGLPVSGYLDKLQEKGANAFKYGLGVICSMINDEVSNKEAQYEN